MRPVRASLLAVLFLGCAGTEPPLQPAAAPVSPAWSALAQEGIAAGEYAPQADGAGVRATNRAQDLHAVFGPRGLNVSGRSGTGEVGLSLRAWGRDRRVGFVGRSRRVGLVARRIGRGRGARVGRRWSCGRMSRPPSRW